MGEDFTCSSSAAIRDRKSGLLLVDVRVVENRLLETLLSRTEPVRDVVSDVTLSARAGLPLLAGSIEDSRDMPGRPLLPDAVFSPGVVSSLLRLYAALPAPLSAVCLNHDGSRDPSDAAI